MIDIGVMIFAETTDDLTNARIFIEYNGFTNEDVRLIMAKDHVAVVTKKANLNIREGFVPYLQNVESANNNVSEHLDTGQDPGGLGNGRSVSPNN